MSTQDLIVRAIQLKKSISFEYIKEGKVRGIRIGNPHAIFGHIMTGNINVHIFQTDGVSDTAQQLPNWRQFLLKHCSDVQILEDKLCFTAAVGYEPNSAMYGNVIAKL